MKRVIVIVGSNNKKSTTSEFVEEILVGASSIDRTIQFEIIQLGDRHLNFCKGCNNCFIKGKCPLDIKDHLNDVKEKLLTSDFIIFASPIYFGNISGIMKTFLDRISYWTHIMALRGKPSIVISTNQSNNHNVGIDYLESCLTFLGSNVVDKLNAAHSFPNQLDDPVWREEHVKKLSQAIIENINDSKSSNQSLEKIFHNLKTIMSYYKSQGVTNFEVNYWEENDFFNKESLQEILNENRNDRNES